MDAFKVKLVNVKWKRYPGVFIASMPVDRQHEIMCERPVTVAGPQFNPFLTQRFMVTR